MKLNCLPQKISMLFLGITFTLLGMGAVVVGVTILPVVGLIFAVPFLCLAFYFYHTHLSSKCEIPDKP